MAASGLLWSLLFLLPVIASTAVTYGDYDISSDKVCSRLGKRELSISLTRPIIVREVGLLLSNWPGLLSFNCRWEIEAKGRGVGVVAVIQKLKFRKYGGECLDHLQFKEDGESNRSPRICGSIMFGMHASKDGTLPPPPPTPLPPVPPTTRTTAYSIISNLFKGTVNPWASLVPPGAVIDPKGELKTYVNVAIRTLRSDESLELVIAYSGYQACDGTKMPPGMFHCGYGLCISKLLVHDGLVNCPFGDCIDEGSCDDARASNLTALILGHSTSKSSGGGISAGVTATSSFFGVVLLMIIFGACILYLLRKNIQRREEQASSEGTAYPQQSGNGDYVGVPTSVMNQTQGQPMGRGMTPPQPMVPPTPLSQPASGTNPIGFCVPDVGTPYPNVGTPYPAAGTPYPGVGTPYPGVGTPYPGVGTPYPGVGTPYPAIGTPYPVQPLSSAPPPPSGDTEVPSAPLFQEPPPSYLSLFPQQKM